MTNAYTLLLGALNKYGKRPNESMVLFGTRLDRLMDYLRGENMSVTTDVNDNYVVFSFSCRNPYINTVDDIEYLYGIIGCSRISFTKEESTENVQVNVQIKGIIKEDNE